MKKFMDICKKIFFSIIMIYCINLIIYSCNVTIPINIFSVGILSFIGTFGLVTLLIIYFII